MSFNMIIWNNLSVIRIIEINVTQFEQPNSSTEPPSKPLLKLTTVTLLMQKKRMYQLKKLAASKAKLSKGKRKTVTSKV